MRRGTTSGAGRGAPRRSGKRRRMGAPRRAGRHEPSVHQHVSTQMPGPHRLPFIFITPLTHRLLFLVLQQVQLVLIPQLRLCRVLDNVTGALASDGRHRQSRQQCNARGRAASGCLPPGSRAAGHGTQPPRTLSRCVSLAYASAGSPRRLPLNSTPSAGRKVERRGKQRL